MLKVLLAGLGVRGRHWAQVIRRNARAELLAYADPDARALASEPVMNLEIAPLLKA